MVAFTRTPNPDQVFAPDSLVIAPIKGLPPDFLNLTDSPIKYIKAIIVGDDMDLDDDVTTVKNAVFIARTPDDRMFGGQDVDAGQQMDIVDTYVDTENLTDTLTVFLSRVFVNQENPTDNLVFSRSLVFGDSAGLDDDDTEVFTSVNNRFLTLADSEPVLDSLVFSRNIVIGDAMDLSDPASSLTVALSSGTTFSDLARVNDSLVFFFGRVFEELPLNDAFSADDDVTAVLNPVNPSQKTVQADDDFNIHDTFVRSITMVIGDNIAVTDFISQNRPRTVNTINITVGLG